MLVIAAGMVGAFGLGLVTAEPETQHHWVWDVVVKEVEVPVEIEKIVYIPVEREPTPHAEQCVVTR